MPRAFDSLTSRTFDLLVVGGGIYGLTIARDAAQRGLTVALIERSDFGSGSSFNHLRTIHGGLRYLQTLDLARARESIRERATLARIAPWALSPMRFVLPLGESLTRGPLAMRAGFALDRLTSVDRNRHVPPTHALPSGRVLTPRRAVAEFPALQGMPMAGAAVWSDYVTEEADRLTLSWGLAAARDGAVLFNYVEATGLLRRGKQVVGATARDVETDYAMEIAAHVVVNATGGVLDALLAPVGVATGLPMLRAVNLVTSREAPPYAIGGLGSSGRNLFMVPWRGRALFGTWESARAVDRTATGVPEETIDAAITDINHAFPSWSISRADVTLVHRGIVPAVVQPDGSVRLDGTEHIHDHADRGVDGLISVAGTKYTTARGVAARTIDLVFRKLSRPAVRSATATTPLPPPPASGEALLRHAAQAEQVVHLDDAIMRRTAIGALGRPDSTLLARAAAVVGDALGWSESDRAREISRANALYEQ